MPDVSVVVPAYNAARFLPEAIDSVLAQSIADVEVIVVDDGSTDGTESVVGRYGAPVRYVRQSNRGVSVARNRGIEESRGRYVAFLDADDTWYPSKLEKQLAALERQADYRACCTAYDVVAEDRSPLACQRGLGRTARLDDFVLLGTVAFVSTIVCERSLLRELDGFDPALSQCADWDMWIRVATRTDILNVDEPLACYRQHGTNMSRNARLLEEDSVRVLQKTFALPSLPDGLRRRKREAYGRAYRVVAGTYFHAGRYRDGVRCLAYALAHDCSQAGYAMKFPARWLGRQRARRLGEAG